jgi:hypothetical protein
VIKIQATTETIESKGGLLLAGKIGMKAGLLNIKSEEMKKAGSIITSLYGLMVEGKSDFESMGEKRGSLFFKESLGLNYVYAKETVRLYLEQMAKDADGIIKQLGESSVRIIKKAPLHGHWIQGKHYFPVDIDGTAMDNSKTKKEGVSRTYCGYEGYHPVMAYVGKEGYILDCELNPGSQHSQKEMATFITRVIGRLRKVEPGGRFLFRLDSGNDAWDTLEAISSKSGCYCIVKRNKRRESDEKWLKRAKRQGKRSEPRKGKKVWVGRTRIHPYMEGMYCVYEVIERKIDSAGNHFLIPEIEVNSWWTNLRCDAEQIISLYRDHATSEQFHSELKHDLGIERLASGKLVVNKILLAVAMNAYNALRLLGQQSVERKFWEKHKRKRLGKVIRDIICVAGKLVKHAGELIFKIHEKNPMLPVFLRLNAVLDGA